MIHEDVSGGTRGSRLGLRVGRGLLAILPLIATDCRRDTQSAAIPLPGRSRPLVLHHWPHPRDFRFGPSEFKPPDPTAALVVTKSGVRAYVIPSNLDPVVRITVALPLGRLYEHPGEAGVSELLTKILTRDARTDGPMPLSFRVESLGTELEVEERLDVTRLSVEVLPEDWRDGLALLIHLLRREVVDDGVVGNYRTGLGYSTSLSGVAGSGFRPAIELGRILGGYPLAPPDQGLAVTFDAVRAMASRTLRPNRVVIGLGGHLSRAEIETALEELTEGWQAGSESPRIATLPEGRPGPGSLHTFDASGLLEGWVAIGRAIGPITRSETAAFAVLAKIFDVRLNIATREMRGLTNRAILVSPSTVSGAGLLHIRTGGRPESVAPLVKFIFDELARIRQRQDSITTEELERAKGALVLGAWQTVLDGARRASTTYAVETVRNGTVDDLMKWPAAVSAVTAEQVKGVAIKYMAPNEMHTVVVGPLERIRQARHPRWPVALDALQITAVQGH